MIQPMSSAIEAAISNVDDWLDTMWSSQGYTGPIAHWWESNLLFTGPLYDWRYEGIIDGYRILFHKTGRYDYLIKAMRAADAVAEAGMDDGRYRNSSFQFGPVAGGTPHEAALDAALFSLAEDLKDLDSSRVQRYRAVAMHNVQHYWVETLWNGHGFRDQPYNPILVANKHGTLLEAMVAANLLEGSWKPYVDSCVEVILSAQVLEGPQSGGTVHRGVGPSKLAIPIYTARAMNGLLSLYEKDPRPIIKEAVLRSVPFFSRTIGKHGAVWGIYGDGRIARFPEMIAGAGDILRFLWRVHNMGWDTSASSIMNNLRDLLLESQHPSGGFPTGYGFSMKGLGGKRPGGIDVRDILPVAGWVDKAFRALALLAPEEFAGPPAFTKSYRMDAHWKGQAVTWEESRTEIVIRRKQRLIYRWMKGEWAPIIYAL